MTQIPSMTVENYTPDNLLAGLTQIVTENMVLAQGQKLVRGTVVGRITVSGKATLATAAATDGSQVPYGILADFYDASLADVGNAAVHVKGEFNENAITLGAGLTLATVHDALRAGGIFLKPSVSAT